MGGLSSIQIIFGFLNFFNFVNPLSTAMTDVSSSQEPGPTMLKQCSATEGQGFGC